MKITDMAFIGIKGSVIALNRATGEQLWATHLKGSDFVNVTVTQGQVLATCYGEVFCLDPLTGAGLWNNRLKGFGLGLATIATADQRSDSGLALLAEKRRRDQEASAAATATTTAACA